MEHRPRGISRSMPPTASSEGIIIFHSIMAGAPWSMQKAENGKMHRYVEFGKAWGENLHKSGEASFAGDIAGSTDAAPLGIYTGDEEDDPTPSLFLDWCDDSFGEDARCSRLRWSVRPTTSHLTCLSSVLAINTYSSIGLLPIVHRRHFVLKISIFPVFPHLYVA